MDDTTKQLLRKAISTTSDSEAITCLNMVKKRTNGTISFDTGGSPAHYKGYTPAQLYDFAVKYQELYKNAEKKATDYDSYVKLYTYYRNRTADVVEENTALRKKVYYLQREVDEVKDKLKSQSILVIIKERIKGMFT